MTVNLIADILAVLDADDAALTAEQTSIEAQIVALQAQLATITELRAESAQFRQLALSFQDGSAAGSVVVPASPALDPTTATPSQSGITNN